MVLASVSRKATLRPSESGFLLFSLDLIDLKPKGTNAPDQRHFLMGHGPLLKLTFITLRYLFHYRLDTESGETLDRQ
jgi:hypothetical protein